MSYDNLYRPDRLFLPQQQLIHTAKELRTPFYLYDEEGIRKSARTVKGSFCWNSGHRPWFPMCVNRSSAVLRILKQEGFGFLIQSAQELRRAIDLGFDSSDFLIHTAAMTYELMELIRMTGAGVIFDSLAQIIRMENELPKLCLLRYHPDKTRNAALFTVNTDKHIAGMSRGQLIEAAKLLRSLGVQSIGLHCHLARNSSRAEYYAAAASELFSLTAELYQVHHIPISHCDIGGGLGVSDMIPNLPGIGVSVREAYRRILPPELRPTLYTELGRFVTARHGILVTSVLEVRERSRNYVILDASSAMLSPRHGEARLSVVGNCSRTGRLAYCVHGCSIGSADRFRDRVLLPKLKPNMLLAIHHTGAYCVPYGAWPLCKEYLYTAEGTIVPIE